MSPLSKKGKKIQAAMEKEYGKEKGRSIMYASINKGRISGADPTFEKRMNGKNETPNTTQSNAAPKEINSPSSKKRVKKQVKKS
jgi:hypothetical protein